MLNILTEAVIRIHTSTGSQEISSLPGVYAALIQDEVEAFPALRPHQRHAWHAFLVQLGAMAMHWAGLIEPPADANEWQRIIRGLTHDDEPWQLVVDDITKPAFMQPPASSNDKWAEYKGRIATADGLDIISTSKNHDVKRGILDDAGTDDWLFALINLQTMGGQIGQGHYPISRMQSGWNSRTAFTLTSSIRWGGHIARDIAALLKVDFKDWPMHWDGVGLLWTKRWDGKKAEALTLDKLHPYYLEVCRRRRLVASPRGLYAVQATSAGRRLATEKNLGVVRDPWQLVDKGDKKGNKALAMQKDSFSYHRIVDYLFQGSDWDLPALFHAKPTDKFLVARGAKGDRGGQTEGYYERIIPLRPKAIQVFGREGDPKALEDIARKRIEQIGKIKDALRHAIATYAAAGKSSKIRPENWSHANPWSNKLDEIADTHFFDDLQDEFEANDNEGRDRIRKEWLRNGEDGVIDHAEKILRAAQNALPCLSIHHYKAQVRADGVFWGRLAGTNGLPELFNQENTNQEGNECPNNDQPTAAQSITEAQIPLFQ